MSTPHGASELDAVTKRVQELSEQVTAKARENGLVWLEQAGKGTGADWAAKVASIHADFVRETSAAVFGVMRAQLKG